jgi:hypothetical protein
LLFGFYIVMPLALYAALVNGDFSSGMTPWEATSGIYLEDGVAVMTEGEANPVSLVQDFELRVGTPSLSFSLSVSLVDNGAGNPQDAFQVSLMSKDDPPVSLVGEIAGFPGALLNIQQTGEIYYTSQVTIPDAPASGEVWSNRPETLVVSVDLSGVTSQVQATLAFDLVSSGEDYTSTARIDNVQTLALPVAANDAATLNEDTPTNIPVLANDSDPDGPDGRPDPATTLVTIEVAPVKGTATVPTEGSAKGTVLYTPNANYSGTDNFSYRIKDATGNESGAAEVAITVTPVNDPPVAAAGPDQGGVEGAVVTLDGSASTDVETVPLIYAWTQTKGTAVTLTGSAAVKPTFTLPEVGAGGDLLVFQLKVTDSGDLESTDTVSVRVADYVKPCDVNDDKIVNLTDAVIMLRASARLANPGISLNIQADVNGDGHLGIQEALCALQSTAGMRTAPDISGVTEICNGIDDNGNLLIDEGLSPANTYYRDIDGDGIGDPGAPFRACGPPPGYVP